MSQTDLDKNVDKYLEEKKLNEINSKLDKIVRNTEGPSLGERIGNSYNDWTESKTKEGNELIKAHREKQGRSAKAGFVQDIVGKSLGAIGALILVFSIMSEHPSQHYDGAVIVRI